MYDNENDSENLRLVEYVEGHGDLIFEWDRRYNVRVYPEDGSFEVEFTLESRDYNALFDLIDRFETDPTLIEVHNE